MIYLEGHIGTTRVQESGLNNASAVALVSAWLGDMIGDARMSFILGSMMNTLADDLTWRWSSEGFELTAYNA